MKERVIEMNNKEIHITVHWECFDLHKKTPKIGVCLLQNCRYYYH